MTCTHRATADVAASPASTMAGRDPAGREVAASDIWGTVLTRRTGNQLEIALAEF